jgi:uncharacterized protein (DUF2062 family)
MPRHLIKRYTPDPAVLKEHKHLRHLGSLLHDENLWHLNRRSVSGGVAAGLFWAMIPMPMQMLAAAFSAVVLRINLPISVALGPRPLTVMTKAGAFGSPGALRAAYDELAMIRRR